MSLHRLHDLSIPEETKRIAQTAFPNGNTYMRMRDELGAISAAEQFAELFSTRGQPAASPARLALVTVMQFAEGLSDRQTADAVRAGIDWKYALGLAITDVGFDASVLSEFRTRWLAGDAAPGGLPLLFEAMLTCLCEKGWLKQRGKLRTDSTHILAAVRLLNRLECVGETLRQALNVVATVAPDWLQEWAPAAWYDRYSRRFEEYRLPASRQARYALGEQIGRDGQYLWEQLGRSVELVYLRKLPALETLRQVWLQQYMVHDGHIQWRQAADLPPATLLIQTPYDREARYSKKRQTAPTGFPTGYKVHLSESCDEALPHLIVNVETTSATTTDYAMTPAIHAHLAI